jgi:spermidine/putrescine transport system permease protein
VTGVRKGVLALEASPATAFVLAFAVAPLVIFFLYSFWEVSNYVIVSNWNLDNYAKAFGESAYRDVYLNTLRIGGLAALVATVVAYLFAHAMRFHLRRWQEPLLFLVIVALFSGYLVRIFAWRTLLGDQGFINEILQSVGLIDQPLTFLLYNRTAAILVLSNFLLPLAILPIYGVLQNIDDAEILAARDLGCGAAGAFWKVTLPHAWPGIWSAFALTFIVASADYLTPSLVGGVDGTMIGQTIATTFLESFNWPAGAAIAFVTLAGTLVFVTVVRVVGDRVLR